MICAGSRCINGVRTEGLTEVFSSHELLERKRELLELDRLVGAARAGHGRLALIEGPAGIGKTRLLDEARLRAEAARVRVLTVRGGELERDFGFGIARQLLEPVLARADRDMRTRLVAGAARLAEPAFATVPGGDVGAPDPTQATLHGLYWLVANLAELSPLLLSVDDVQWADRPSLRFLIHLARRLDGLAVVVALATRTGEEVGEARLLQALLLEAGTPVLRPKELSEEAVAAMVAAELGEGAGPMLSSACHAATGGNPSCSPSCLTGFATSRAPPPRSTPRSSPDSPPSGLRPRSCSGSGASPPRRRG
jgi:AAA ATPase domain